MMLALELTMQSPAPPPALAHAEELEFEAVYAKYFNFVWRSLLRLGVRDAAAEDLAQEVFFIVHQRLHLYEGRSTLKTWIFGVVLGVVRNHRRAMARRKTKHALATPAQTLGTVEDPDDALRAREAREILYALLDELDESRREVFVMAELEQIPVVEIAEALAENVNTVYSRLRQARIAFQKAAARHRARDDWRKA
ncbi:MAG: sigma-70 family RNA polymerase sigma factor [Myxococcales bacterium]|nr:sigma-70 family RNA polymerase sigma factor [Myxococcales bacterium]